MSNRVAGRFVRYAAAALPQIAQPIPFVARRVSTQNLIDGGAYKIVGTTKNQSTPENVPVSRLVILHEMCSGRVIASQWSATNGDYEFSAIRTGKYYVCSFDHTGSYNAVIADNVPVEPM